MKPTKQTIQNVAFWGLVLLAAVAFWGLFYGLLWLGWILGFTM